MVTPEVVTVAFLDAEEAEPWREALARRISDLDFRVWPKLGDAAEIRYALTFRPPPGAFRKLTGLRAVLALGAGVEAILACSDLPEDVPIVKLADKALVREMTDYVLMNVLRHHRDAPAYARQQAQKIWRRLPYRPPAARRVGVMGLGNLGAAAARALAAREFDVAGWSRSGKEINGVEAFAGLAALDDFLARTDILVVLLPLTEETGGLLDAARLARLPRGASVINAGRGAVIVEPDLLAALDAGALSHASLDVFAEEPLPENHPFWDHARVTITPHTASVTDREAASDYFAEIIAADRAGRRPPNLVERRRGY